MNEVPSWGGVQYVDSRNVEKNADKMEMPNTKCRLGTI